MIRHAGFTLLEVLVALAILTLIATTTLPLMRAATAVLSGRERADVELAELARFADVLMQAEPHLPRNGEIAWPDHPERSPVRVQSLPATTAAAADHGWLRFECGDLSLWRWYAIDAPGAEVSRR